MQPIARMGTVAVVGLMGVLGIATVVLEAQRQVAPPGGRQPQAPSTPRVAPLAEAKRTDGHRKVAAAFPNAREIDHGFDTLLNVPALAEGVMPYTTYLTTASTLTPRHRELLILRAAWLGGNQVIWADHAARAKKAGLGDADLRRIAEGPAARGWDPFEVTLLTMTDELFRNSSISQKTWAALSASYDLHHLMDAVETANHFVVLSMLYNSFAVQPDPSTPDRLPTSVPYRINVPAREPALKAARVEPLPGEGIAVNRTFARHAELNKARSPRANFINRVSKLTPRDREIFILRIGWDCQSEYEWAQHVGSVGRARDWGLDPVKIADGPSAQGWTPFEQTILRAVDELYRDTMVSDATWKALSAEYDTEHLMSGVFTASSYRATSMSLNAYGVQLEAGNERFPR